MDFEYSDKDNDLANGPDQVHMMQLGRNLARAYGE
jgi:hypothetical protein